MRRSKKKVEVLPLKLSSEHSFASLARERLESLGKCQTRDSLRKEKEKVTKVSFLTLKLRSDYLLVSSARYIFTFEVKEQTFICKFSELHFCR